MHDQARRGYGTAGAAAAYERGRPGYPEDAVAELVRVLGVAPGATVLDLAAGTGKLTRQLMATVATLVAVEPVAAMRDQLARLAAGKVLGGAEPANPADGPGGGLSVLGGTAEAIPLRDGSLDAVTVGQAFHWFDAGRALAELARVVRAGGRLGLIWNARDRSTEWIDAVWAVMDRVEDDAPWREYGDGRTSARQRGYVTGGEAWSDWTEATFHHVQYCSHEDLVDRVRSVSHIAALPPASQREVLEEVRSILRDRPETSNTQMLGIPYRVDAMYAERLS